jgi:hypothetical protein
VDCISAFFATELTNSAFIDNQHMYDNAWHNEACNQRYSATTNQVVQDSFRWRKNGLQSESMQAESGLPSFPGATYAPASEMNRLMLCLPPYMGTNVSQTVSHKNYLKPSFKQRSSDCIETFASNVSDWNSTKSHWQRAVEGCGVVCICEGGGGGGGVLPDP